MLKQAVLALWAALRTARIKAAVFQIANKLTYGFFGWIGVGMYSFKIFLVLGFLGLGFVGCTTVDLEKQLDEKVAKETYVEVGTNIPSDAFVSINSNNGLSDDDKKQLTSLVSKVMMDLSKTRSDIAKLKKILFANLVSGDNRSDENLLIKRRIIDLDKRRLDRMFSALDEAEKIIKNRKEVKPQSLEFLLDIDRYHMQDIQTPKK